MTRLALSLAVGVCVIAFLAPSQRSSVPHVSGTQVRVIDGDTLRLAGVTVRLEGVAAPELDEPFGRAAKRALERLIAGDSVSCALHATDNYGRRVGVCALSDGLDLGLALVGLGLARDCPRYSQGRYAVHETAQGRQLPFPPYCSTY